MRQIRVTELREDIIPITRTRMDFGRKGVIGQRQVIAFRVDQMTSQVVDLVAYVAYEGKRVPLASFRKKVHFGRCGVSPTDTTLYVTIGKDLYPIGTYIEEELTLPTAR